MRFVERNLWPCLALVLVACSLITEFPEPHEKTTGGVRGVRDAGSGSGASCNQNTDCSDDELCCDSKCVATSKDSCTACGQEGACNETASSCNNRVCECGSEKACTGGRVCDSKAGKCVGCLTSANCAAHGDQYGECVDQMCVDCDRKDPANFKDDIGCESDKPICSAAGICERCKTDDQCGPGRTCNGSSGCLGCSVAEMDLTKNNCEAAHPICGRDETTNTIQCRGCKSNRECTGGFCNEDTGRCHSECDPKVAEVQSGNGCEMPGAPSCKPDAANVYSCQPCTTTADCAHNLGTTCVTTPGPQFGMCVRGPVAAACAAPTPGFLAAENKCVECTLDMHCTASAVGKYCNLTEHKCAPCTALGRGFCAGLPGGTPLCLASGLCGTGTCRADRDCRVTPATPICNAGTCTGCNALPATINADEACDSVVDDSRCVTASVAGAPVAGSCAACNPGVAAPMNGCDTADGDNGLLCLPSGGSVSCQCMSGAADNGCGPGIQCLPGILGSSNRCGIIPGISPAR